MTVSCYRRLYESAVGYGLSKSFDANLQTLCADPDSTRPNNDNQTRTLSAPRSADWQDERVLRLKEYYEGELTKKDEIISQQRVIMRALNLSSVTADT